MQLKVRGTARDLMIEPKTPCLKYDFVYLHNYHNDNFSYTIYQVTKHITEALLCTCLRYVQ